MTVPKRECLKHAGVDCSVIPDPSTASAKTCNESRNKVDRRRSRLQVGPGKKEGESGKKKRKEEKCATQNAPAKGISTGIP